MMAGGSCTRVASATTLFKDEVCGEIEGDCAASHFEYMNHPAYDVGSPALVNCNADDRGDICKKFQPDVKNSFSHFTLVEIMRQPLVASTFSPLRY